jgi:arsenite/tail-anchored protein-transporting ATPase
LNAARTLARWLDAHRQALADALEHGTWLAREDAEALLELPVPGVDELVGLLEIARLADRYDAVVVDTAPTGHALRLMAAPEAVAAAAAALDALQADHRIVREQLARISRPEASDRVIALIAQQAGDASRLLRDSRRTSFHWVTLPEQLAVAESEDGIAALTEHGIPVTEIVVNRVIPDQPPCPTCDPRRGDERRILKIIERSLAKGRTLRIVPAALTEPRGVRALQAIARHLTARPGRMRAAKSPRTSRAPARARRIAAGIATASIDAVQDAALVFVGGKGGVGKTTVAAALAVRLAHDAPDRSVVLLSTDPAHSVADVLGSPLGDDVRAVRGAPPNLIARELNAPRAFEIRRDELRASLADLPSAADAQIDQLLTLAPPGVDELFGMLSLVEALASNGGAAVPAASRRVPRTVIVDTAPTGHALRLLEMPDTAREWVQVLLRLLVKYRQIAKPGRLASALVDVSRSIRELQTLLRDRRRTRFIVVTRAAAVARAETVRLMARLRSLSIDTTAIVANARTLEPRRCRRCLAAAAAERREMAALGRAARRCAIIEAPLVAPPPRGAAELNAWARTWARRRTRGA